MVGCVCRIRFWDPKLKPNKDDYLNSNIESRVDLNTREEAEHVTIESHNKGNEDTKIKNEQIWDGETMSSAAEL
ncbi:unnamed protein product [Cochlearia groenlandica]